MALPSSVHLLPLEFEFRGQPATLSPLAIETDRGLLLVDTGLQSTVDQLEARLGDTGVGLSDLRLVLLTHQDIDHVDGLANITAHAAPVVVASEHAARIIDGREDPRGGVGRGRAAPVPVDVELAGWGTLDTRAGPARVVPTPGHTPGHVSLYLPDERLLVAGDALTADDDGLQGPDPEMSEDVETALDSVARLADLDVDHIVCYHGGYVEAGSERIAEIAAGE